MWSKRDRIKNRCSFLLKLEFGPEDDENDNLWSKFSTFFHREKKFYSSVFVHWHEEELRWRKNSLLWLPTLDSGVNVGPTFINFGFFFETLLKGPTFVKFCIQIIWFFWIQVCTFCLSFLSTFPVFTLIQGHTLILLSNFSCPTFIHCPTYVYFYLLDCQNI